MEHWVDQHKILTDLGLSGGTLSAPLWWGNIAPVLQGILLVGGVILLALRLHITYREWRAQ